MNTDPNYPSAPPPTGLSREDKQFLQRLNRFAKKHHWTDRQIYNAIHQHVRLGVTPWGKAESSSPSSS